MLALENIDPHFKLAVLYGKQRLGCLPRLYPLSSAKSTTLRLAQKYIDNLLPMEYHLWPAI